MAFVNHLDGVCPTGLALLNTRPPAASGSDVAALELADGASGATPAMVQKQRQICSSCLCDSSTVNSGRTVRGCSTTIQKQQPCELEALNFNFFLKVNCSAL